MSQTQPTDNCPQQTVPAVVATVDMEETESNSEAFAAPAAVEHELNKTTMLPFKDHKFGTSC